jgi:transposase
MSRKRSRRANFTAAQKVSIVREHLLGRVPISDLCDRHGLKPNQFYLWQKRLFEQGAKAFESPRDSRERQLERKLQKLQNVAREKDEVIAEVAAEMVRLKKGFGGA